MQLAGALVVEAAVVAERRADDVVHDVEAARIVAARAPPSPFRRPISQRDLSQVWRTRKVTCLGYPMAAVGRWLLRLFSMLALVLFAALAVIFTVVTVQHIGEKEYVSDSVDGLPPVWVISAILILPCLAFVAGFWLLFMDTFRGPSGPKPP